MKKALLVYDSSPKSRHGFLLNRVCMHVKVTVCTIVHLLQPESLFAIIFPGLETCSFTPVIEGGQRVQFEYSLSTV